LRERQGPAAQRVAQRGWTEKWKILLGFSGDSEARCAVRLCSVNGHGFVRTRGP
jgi:hypothetical protein